MFNYFRETTPSFAEIWLDEMLEKKGTKKKMMGFDYWE